MGENSSVIWFEKWHITKLWRLCWLKDANKNWDGESLNGKDDEEKEESLLFFDDALFFEFIA